MTKREAFIEVVENELVRNYDGIYDLSDEEYQKTLEMFSEFWESFKNEKPAADITENGKKVILFMQENMETYNNLFKAKDVGEGLFVSSRTVSGAMRKLIADNYVIKVGGSPVVYSLSDAGKNLTFDN